MSDDLFVLPPTYRLYSHKSIYAATFFGGPLVAGYLAAENFKCLDQPEKAKSAWLISIAITILIYVSAVLVPEIEKLPRVLIPFIYAISAQGLVMKYQGDALKHHKQTGGKFFQFWRIVFITLIGFVISFAIVFLILILLRPEVLK